MRRVAVGSLGTIVAGLPGCLVALATVELLPHLSRRRPAPVDGVEVAARLLVVVGAGVPLVPALESVAGDVAGVEEVVRRSRRLGSAAALGSASGPLAPLLRRLADCAAAGFAPEPAIRSYIENERRRRHTRAVERARRLPVKLMVPMTLLVLPGFVVMVYGPAFIDLVTSLVGPLVG